MHSPCLESITQILSKLVASGFVTKTQAERGHRMRVLGAKSTLINASEEVATRQTQRQVTDCAWVKGD